MLQIIKHPDKLQYKKLTKRPEIDNVSLTTGIQTIFNEVKRNGDLAILNYTEKFDGVKLENLVVQIGKADDIQGIDTALKSSIQVAYENIFNFHKAQQAGDLQLETMAGIVCTQKSVPIHRVGLYIPGGSAPLFSTVLMLAIPAKIAGCSEVVLCTPPDKKGKIHPAIMYTAALCGIRQIFLAGGSQAIAGMTFGTSLIPAVDKIFGPGNQYVTAAKQLAQQYGVAIDMPAGPSEVLIYADQSCDPEFVAADLLAQAEHGFDSQVILVSEYIEIIDRVNIALAEQLPALPRQHFAKEALSHSKAILMNSVSDSFDFINYYAPEHLIVASEMAADYIDKIRNAGSVFLGNYCPESAGDYASGTNHTLPTNGWARSYSGVNLDSFLKKITFQQISESGIKQLGPDIINMAEAEELQGHANSVKIRLNKLK
jgi:histidinol dehydrogenase